MREVIVEQFGGPEVLKVRDVDTPEPGPGEVRIAITSIGMNHAEIMMREGKYKIASGDPPFVPGLEAGGIIDAAGEGVTERTIGQRVVLGVDAPRNSESKTPGGSYRSHYICTADQAIVAPDEVDDDQLGAMWLPYLTVWGALVWRHDLQPGATVAIPAASSSLGLAAAQIVKERGATAIGLTTSPEKVELLQGMESSVFDDLIVTDREGKWGFELKKKTGGKGADVFFDPVAAGKYLQTEILSVAHGGTIWIYGLLGQPDVVDVTPLIRKDAAIRGWALTELVNAGQKHLEEGYKYVLDGFAAGKFTQHVGGVFKLEDAADAHREMEKGNHVGKLVLKP